MIPKLFPLIFLLAAIARADAPAPRLFMATFGASPLHWIIPVPDGSTPEAVFTAYEAAMAKRPDLQAIDGYASHHIPPTFAPLAPWETTSTAIPRFLFLANKFEHQLPDEVKMETMLTLFAQHGAEPYVLPLYSTSRCRPRKRTRYARPSPASLRR